MEKQYQTEAPRFKIESLASTTAILCYLALASFVFHMVFAGNYGYFRDELYYIVSGTQHLSLGYVDFPPFIAYVAALLYPITGDSLISIHAVSALVEACLVFLAGMIARELGGGKKGQILAAASVLVMLALLADGSLFGPDSFDQLWWSLLSYMIIRTIRRKEPKLWILAGVAAGVGLLTKLTTFFFVTALLVSFLAIASARKNLRSKWIAIGGLLSLAFILPMLYWNFVNEWPMITFYLEFRGDVGGGGPLAFFAGQLGLINYLNIPILVAGLYFYLRSSEGRELRAFGLSYILLYVFMTLANLKPYYLAPIYPMLFAGGAILVEKSSLSKKGIFRRFGSKPFVAALIIITILLAPLLVPILSPPTLVSTYGESTLQSANGGVVSGETGPLPQNLGDRLGWNEMVSTLAQVYSPLNSSEKSGACVFTSNYGEASAVNFLGKGLGLPQGN